MTRADQVDFVQALARTLSNEIVSKIHAGEIPEAWDGHELRALLACLACRSTSGLIPIMAAAKGRRVSRVREFLGVYQRLF